MALRRTIVLLVLFITLFSIVTVAQTPKLTQNSKVVLFTCEPGSELYAGFGHSALWVSDPFIGVDRLYNYGTFDFNTPNFYLKFIRGKLNYMITVTTVGRFIREYDYRKIGVTGQTLNLELNEKQQLYELLETNLKPENKYYKYDFFYDNCATRIRDVVVDAVDGDIDFNTADRDISFRKMLFPYLNHKPWTRFGINLILGLTSDKIATPDQYMYLPRYMQAEFDNAIVIDNNEANDLVSSETQYLKSKLNFSGQPFFSPVVVFTLMFLIFAALTFWEYKTGRYFKWVDTILNSIAVIAGLFLFFMWVGTDHIATNRNLNTLWLLPAQALFLYAQLSKTALKYQLVKISFVYTIIITVVIHFWPQQGELSFSIINMIFALRYLFYERLNQSNSN